MTDPHLSSDELADLDVGLLSPAREQQVRAHLDTCAECRAELAQVRHVSDVLAALPRPAVPAAVGARIDAVLAELARSESRVRPEDGDRPGGPGLPLGGAAGGTTSTGSTGSRAPAGPREQRADATASRTAAPDRPGRSEPGGLLAPVRPTLGSLESNFRRHRRRPVRIALGVLAACAVAGAVGFGGYLLSAVSGHNEPTADSPVVVSGGELGSTTAVETPGRLSPHRFSSAWNCVRKVTDGRITGIESSVVGGEPGLLVYLRGQGGSTRVVFVSGCDTGAPSAGPSALIPKR